MPSSSLIQRFCDAARLVGAEIHEVTDVTAAAECIAKRAAGPILLPPFASGLRLGLGEALRQAGARVIEGDLRPSAPSSPAGVTGANFAIAETGTVVLESTSEAVRLASTLPERHFVLLDPRKVVDDGDAAIPHLRTFHQRQERNYLAYITGPSRTADIERVLTIGVHGPRELHILLLEGLSADFLEM